MTLGKKIGGGFAVLIVLTIFLGGMAYRAMDESSDASDQIAGNRVPRLVDYSALQSDLLRAAYWSRSFFSLRDEAMFNKFLGYMGSVRNDLEKLKELNVRYHFPTTATFLQEFGKDAERYEALNKADKEALARLEKANEEMFAAGAKAQGALEILLATMAATQGKFLEDGDYKSASQYGRNLASVGSTLARVSDVFAKLLMAERNRDVDAFEKSRELLPIIANDFRGIDKFLLRRECKDLYADTLQSYEMFSARAEEVSRMNVAMAKADRGRMAQVISMQDKVASISDTTTRNVLKLVDDTAATLNSGTRGVLLILVVVGLIGIIIAVIITRAIVGPLTITQRFAEEVAAGDLDQELAVHSSDEVGRLADSLRAMVASLRSNIDDARQKSEQAQKATVEARAATTRAEEAARQAETARRDGMLAAAGQLEGMVEIISSASTQLSAQIEQSDRGATESATRLSEAATAMNEMNATVQEVARNAGSASQASADTKHKAEAGAQVVHQVVQSIGEVHEVSLQLKADMGQLNERAQDINRIMGVISDIADQTNLLALNAAIEAARAGEAGRGFAVVADEVRKLAEKTMTSTLDVSNAIRAIQESTDMSMAAVDNAVVRIGEATELANQSGEALEEIVATVDATSDQVQAIAAASEEQSAASDEINRSIIEVNDMSRMTADAMSEASQAVADLANQANRLTSLIHQMKNA